MGRSENYRKWIPEENQFLKDNADRLTIIQLAEALNRTSKSVSVQMSRRKIGALTKYKAWTGDELELVKSLRGKVPIKEISIRIGRTVTAIRVKFAESDLSGNFELNIKTWSCEEINELIQVHKEYTIGELAKLFNRSVSSITHKLNILGLVQKPINNPWSEDDIKFLFENYGKLTHKEIAIALNRTKNAITNKLMEEKRFPNKKQKINKKFTAEEDDELQRLIESDYNIRQISIKMKKTARNLYQRSIEIGVHIDITKEARCDKFEWTEDSIQYLIDNFVIELGCITRLAKELGRGVKAVRKKIYELRLLDKHFLICEVCHNPFNFGNTRTNKVCSVECRKRYHKNRSNSISGKYPYFCK